MSDPLSYKVGWDDSEAERGVERLGGTLQKLDGHTRSSLNQMRALRGGIQGLFSGDIMHGIDGIMKGVGAKLNPLNVLRAGAAGFGAFLGTEIGQAIDSAWGKVSSLMGGSGAKLSVRIANAFTGMDDFMKYQSAMSALTRETKALNESSLSKLTSELKKAAAAFDDTVKASERLAAAEKRRNDAQAAIEMATSVSNRPADEARTRFSKLARELTIDEGATAREITMTEQEQKNRDARLAELKRVEKEAGARFQAFGNVAPSTDKDIRNRQLFAQHQALEQYRVANASAVQYETQTQDSYDSRSRRLVELRDRAKEFPQQKVELGQERDATLARLQQDEQQQIDDLLRDIDEKAVEATGAHIARLTREIATLRKTLKAERTGTRGIEQIQRDKDEFDRKQEELAQAQEDQKQQESERAKAAESSEALRRQQWGSRFNRLNPADTRRLSRQTIERLRKSREQMLREEIDRASRDYADAGDDPDKKLDALRRLDELNRLNQEEMRSKPVKAAENASATLIGGKWINDANRKLGLTTTDPRILRMTFDEHGMGGSSANWAARRRMGESLAEYQARRGAGAAGDYSSPEVKALNANGQLLKQIYTKLGLGE